jgi:hypothetical protein
MIRGCVKLATKRVSKQIKNILNSEKQQMVEFWIFELKRNCEASTNQLQYLRNYAAVAKYM